MATAIAVNGWSAGTHLGMTEPASIATNRVIDRTVGTQGTNVQILSAAARTGGYGLRLTANAATAHAGWANTGNGGRLTGGVIVESFWFRFPGALPTGDFNIWIGIGTGGGNDAYIKFLSSTGGLQAVLGANTQLGPTGIVADTWYHADVRAVLNSGSQTLDWRISGTAQPQVTLSATTQDLLFAGVSSDNTTNPGTIDVDDWLMSQTSADYPIGPHHVETLFVDTGGTVTTTNSADFQTFTANGTMAAWNATTARNNIDETPPTISASADGFAQTVISATDYVEIPMTSYTLAGGESVTAARMLACGWAASTSGATIGFRSWNGTTERTLLATANPTFTNSTTAPRWVCKMLTTADVDTQGELDALAFRVGFSSDVTPNIGIHGIWAEVAVTVASGGATATPAVVAGVGAVPQATPSAGATQAPAAVTGVLVVPQAVPSLPAVASPAQIPAVVAVPQASASGSATAAPAAISGVLAVPAPTVRIDAVAAPAVVGALVSVPGPSIALGTTAAPAAVAAVLSVPQASPLAGGGATVTPSAVPAVVGVPAPTASGAASVSPAAAAGVLAVPGPSALAGAAAHPAAVAGAVSLGQPGESVGAGPAAAALLGSVPQAVPLAGGGAVAAPGVVPASVSVPAATPSAAALVAPAAVQVQMAVPAAGASGAAISAPSVVALATGFPLPLTLVDGVAAPGVTVLVVHVPTAHPDSGAPVRDLVLVGYIEAGRFSGTIAAGRYAGALQPGRLTGDVEW